MRGLDQTIFYWINRWPEWLNPVFQFFSEGNKWWSVRIAIIGLFIYLVYRKATRNTAVLAVLAAAFTNIAADFVKSLTQMNRPCVDLDDVIVRVNKLTSYGMFSAHSANMAAVAVVFLMLTPRLGYAWLLVAMMTGISRIYVGVHYPSQVLVGWLCGGLIGFALVRIDQMLDSRKRRLANEE